MHSLMTWHVSIFNLISRISHMGPLKGAHDRRQVISRSNNVVSLENADNAENIILLMLKTPRRLTLDFISFEAALLESWCFESKGMACKWQVGVRIGTLLPPQIDLEYHYALIMLGKFLTEKIATEAINILLKFACPDSRSPCKLQNYTW